MSNGSDATLDAQAEAYLMRMLPRRRAVPRLAPQLARAERYNLDTRFGTVAAWRMGQGPAVLMVHGWEDDNSLWEPAIDCFRQVGRAIVVVDLPGHGHSRAGHASPRVAAAAINAVAAHVGPIDSLVTHSYGGAVSVAAMEAGLAVNRAVLFAATIPHRMTSLVAQDVPPDVRPIRARATELYAARTGLSLELYDIAAAVPRLTVPALFIHSADDPYPAANAEHLAQLWPGSRMLLVDGFGHRAVARDPAILAHAVRFLGQGG